MQNKLTPQKIDDLIEDVSFLRPDASTLTVCVLKLTNGCTVVGTSNVIDPANFDDELGKVAAKNNARNKIWELEGYAMKRALVAASE